MSTIQPGRDPSSFDASLYNPIRFPTVIILIITTVVKKLEKFPISSKVWI